MTFESPIWRLRLGGFAVKLHNASWIPPRYHAKGMNNTMENETFTKAYSSFLNFNPDRYGKATLYENERILVGLNCLKPGQMMQKHAHQIQTRFYLVLEGKGLVWVDDEQKELVPGLVIWVAPGKSHRIEQKGSSDLIMLVGIAPAHAD
jgi:quercetin dioxygenase-like cupin family protein